MELGDLRFLCGAHQVCRVVGGRGLRVRGVVFELLDAADPCLQPLGFRARLLGIHADLALHAQPAL